MFCHKVYLPVVAEYGMLHTLLEPRSRRFRLEQMPYMEFYHGLRERNWTSPWYKEDATPWRVQFFQDSGRFMAPSYPGYRCAVAARQLAEQSTFQLTDTCQGEDGIAGANSAQVWLGHELLQIVNQRRLMVLR